MAHLILNPYQGERGEKTPLIRKRPIKENWKSKKHNPDKIETK